MQEGLFDAPAVTTRRVTIPHVELDPPPSTRTARPAHMSPVPAGTDAGAAVAGAQLLGLPLTRQGLELAAVCEADRPDGRALYRIVTVLSERRTAKTTSVWALMLGRCLKTPNSRIIYTAQSGLLARRRFLDVVRALAVSDFDGTRNPLNQLGRVYRGAGAEAIQFLNGSEIRIVPPDPGAFRGEAADLVVFDEAGELDPEKSPDLIGAALPLINTRHRGQVLIAGTPGPARAGLLWENLQRGIVDLDHAAAGERRLFGVLAYMLPEGERWGSYDENGQFHPDWSVVETWHPGIGELTQLEDLQADYLNMTVERFAAEYLCVFPTVTGESALDVQAWLDCAAGTGLPPRPDRVGLAFDVSPDGSAAAVAAAWRDDQGRAHLELLAYQPGTDWLPAIARAADTKHRQAGGIAYDPIGQNLEVAERMSRTPRVRQRPLNARQLVGAAARLDREIMRRNVVHYDQPDLTAGIEKSAWRPYSGGRLFQRAAPATAALVAASAALWVYDQTTPQQTTHRIRSSVQIQAERVAASSSTARRRGAA